MSQALRAHWPPVMQAAHDLVNRFEADGVKGAKALAPRIGKKPHVLNNEVNFNLRGPKLGIVTAYFMEKEAGYCPILDAYNYMHNRVSFALPSPDVFIGDVDLLVKFTEWQAAMGETCNEIQNAFNPKSECGNKISKREAARIRKRGMFHIEKFMVFLTEIEELAE